MDDPTEQTVSFISTAVTGRAVLASTETGTADAATVDATYPAQQAGGMAVQSVAQSMAIAIQDATDMLRNVSTIATTAMGVAAAKWIETPEMVLYKQIIDTAQGLIQTAAGDFLTIGQNAATVLSAFPAGTSKQS
ncbi:MAG: hypothetical protein IPH07_07440 [Deltaproteobacteria bacterium]|nr:hypothetical protein [Deltaproteobacteria bacterium]MBK8717806.1 hypothetical protein [Deltaproteobacteria bacterium]MBP7287833.1 hypothetical protein [Nannocystaceae bacterium]